MNPPNPPPVEIDQVYYNEQTGELEFISAGQIDPDGNVELVFTHASDYTIVVDVCRRAGWRSPPAWHYS